mmetsp:Transcript_31276/g.103949  ORF Transcript_31276/g.103949 Transcript_31276/m.103949 type:complete len:275 (+) Transcript_31276:55-879(+)|eukprot:CAMPEP_0203963644 /NCGR_PEP_ID=MMETSP0359-20131031/93546_1 /ASSEMBLY_ACC=CAM_ASM_000338 /TAXON_ID=268821 /ORGANISM="Scrippsiella Hangoei, Strain SHTV-5" /LENGTH=274 /DNA_ID=CAMNT_0050899589 /DNA_START=46 /DNA_END=870 /DNA_ORIENTATION=+
MAGNRPPPCCPAGAEPMLIVRDYVPRGEMVTIGHTPVYIASPPSPSARGVVVFSDMFGVHTGRHKQLCDRLAEQGLLVACPDFFAENPYMPNAPAWGTTVCCVAGLMFKFMSGKLDKNTRNHTWDASMREKVVGTLLPWMKEKGAKEFVSLGFCWGAYGAMKCAALPEFRCSAVFHPSVDGFCKSAGEDDLQICRELKCPILVVSTKQEKPAWQPGGTAQGACEEAVPGKVAFRTETQNHGYMMRAEVNKDATALAAVNRGVQEILDLVNANLS